ncbi:MAG: LacI family transcriptional regulator [Actinobacteria bacterium]|nr:LacI family transcriptional regulator [Actinomycetota bacterium]
MVNIKDVAKKANVSTASVSRYLNNPELLKEITKEKIKDAVKGLNYRPSLIAQGMRKQTSTYILLVLEDIVNPFYTKVLNGAQQLAADEGYHLVVLDEERCKEKNFFSDILLSGGFTGVIYCMSMNENDGEILKELKKAGIPIVLIDNELFKKNFTSINTNNHGAAYRGTKYLIEKGHKNIALVCFNKFHDQVEERVRGYKDALHDNFIMYNPSNIYTTDLSVKGGEAVAKKILEELKLKRYTAIFAVSDAIAIGIMKYFNRNNVNIPDEISILGFDDISWCEIVTPSLTTIHQKSTKLGSLAVKKLIDMIEKRQKKEVLIELDTFIVERESVKDLKNLEN